MYKCKVMWGYNVGISQLFYRITFYLFLTFLSRKKGYLNFKENERIWIGEGYVTKSLENPPYFLNRCHSSNAYSCEATHQSTIFCSWTNQNIRLYD